MSENQPKETGLLSHFKGALVTAFGMTPLGTAMGLNPILNSPLVKTGLNETSKDTARDLGLAVKYLVTLGDKQAANKTADEIEEGWRKHITQNIGMGQSEFRLGGGWKLPANTLYNGKMDKEREGKELPIDAVFLRKKNGIIEVLDHNDPRYLELAMPYIAGQVAIPIGAGKAIGAIKFLANGSKIVEGISKGADIAGKAVSTANTVGGIGYGVSITSSMLILKPEAISKISHLLDNPKKMTPDRLRQDLNTVFEQYSYLNGPMSEQYFVPPLESNQDPLQRLQDLAKGTVRKVFESSTPFDRITDLTNKSKNYRAHVGLSDSHDEIRENLDFQRGFLRLAQKTMSGNELSNQETIMLKFGMNIYTGLAANILPEKGNDFSDIEKSKIKKDLQTALEARFFPTSDHVSEDQIKVKLSSRLSKLDAEIAERDKPKNPIIQNRIDSPFVMG
ncbi:MAG TPA: hypothetical protein DCM27_05745 [Rhodospirillaceae bacterium]|nr:hypothetical protein [Rhodospirillaceae bacterium]